MRKRELQSVSKGKGAFKTNEVGGGGKSRAPLRKGGKKVTSLSTTKRGEGYLRGSFFEEKEVVFSVQRKKKGGGAVFP